MKKLALLVMVFFLAFNCAALAYAPGNFDTTLSASGPNGPAPNSGDGVHDGSGQDSPFGPFWAD